MRSICILFLLLLLPAIAHALSDADHKRLQQTCPAYVRADEELGKYWKSVLLKLTPQQRKEALNQQREWVRTGRDAMAREFMKAGLSFEDAYVRAIIRRIHELDALVYYQSMSKEDIARGAVKTDSYFLHEDDYPEYFEERAGGDPAARKTVKAHEPTADEDPVPADVQKFQAAEAIFEAESNRLRFDSTYKNRYITIVGIINDVKEKDGNYLVTLYGPFKDNPLKFVVCHFGTKHRDDLMRLNKGNTVAITGVYEGEQLLDMASISLFACRITM